MTFTWVLLYKSGNGVRAELLRKVFNFMLSELTQTQSPELGYVTVPQAAFEKTMAEVDKIGVTRSAAHQHHGHPEHACCNITVARVAGTQRSVHLHSFVGQPPWQTSQSDTLLLGNI